MVVQPHLGLSDWTFEPTVSFGTLLVVAVYLLAWRRGVLTGHDDVSAWLPSARLRPWLFGLGMVAAVVALQSPIDLGGDTYLFWLHMIQHLLLMVVAPPLVLLGFAGGRAAAAPGRLGAAWHALTRPWTACVAFNAVLLVWHIPTLYEATLTTEPIHVVEHITFIAAGVVLWWPVVDPFRARAEATPSGMTKIAMLVVAGVPPTVLGFVFVAAPQALYPFYALAPRLWGFSPTGDQQLAGVLMLGAGNVVYFLAIAVIFVRMFGDAGDDEAEAALHHARVAAGDGPAPATETPPPGRPGAASSVSPDLVGSRSGISHQGGATPRQAGTHPGEQTQ